MSNGRNIPTPETAGIVNLSILSEGNPIDSRYQVLSAWVIREVNRVPVARLVIRDGDVAREDFEISNTDHFIPGKEIEIKAGYGTEDSTIFKGIVIKHSVKVGRNGSTRLKVECKDECVKLTVGRKNKYFSELTDSGAIEEIIDTYGLDKEVETTNLTHPELVQFHTTDWDFICARAEANGQLVVSDDGNIRVEAPDLEQDSEIVLRFGANIKEFEAEMDARNQYGAVTGRSWSYADQELVEATGEDPAFDEPGNLEADSLSAVVGLDSYDLHHSGQVVDQELQAWADAGLLKSRLAKIRGRVKFQGYAPIKPAMMMDLQGVGARFNGSVFVSAVRHEISRGNWWTDVQFGLAPQWFAPRKDIDAPPAGGLLPAVKGLQIGVVTQLESDPLGEDRILVRLPLVDNQAEGIWSRVASLDAGENRGAFFRPEIGDEVVVGFLNDDPRDAIVLGMLNSSSKPAPVQAADDNHEKGFVTRSEMKLMFNDEVNSVTLETPAGNSLVISEEDKGISLEDENGNSITLNDSGIEIKSVSDLTLEAAGKMTLKASQDVSVEGLNIDVTASAQFKAEGSAGAEVSTGAIAVLKGSLVQIN